MGYNNNDLFDKSTKWKIVGGVLGAVLGGTLIIGLVIYMNESNSNSKKKYPYEKRVLTEEEVLAMKENENEVSLEESGLTSKDLDFWNVYSEDEENSVLNSSDFDGSNSITGDAFAKSEKEDGSVSKNILSGNKVLGPDDKSTNQFNVGSEDNPEYVDIVEEIPKNNYIPGAFKLEGQELSYYSSNRKISSYGIDVSKYQGIIDWDKVANSGIDFAMIRMGVRGYSSGQVVIDESFTGNIVGAISHGIDVGVYFYSQATNAAEAVEEANYAVAAVQGYAVSYPIAFYTETINSDKARTDDLTADTLTEIATAFCNTVEGYGYKSMICANKSQFANRLNMSDLSDKAVFLIDPLAVQNEDSLIMSDYPYTYSMWQYSSVGKIDGIEGDVNLDISFVDYKYR